MPSPPRFNLEWVSATVGEAWVAGACLYGMDAVVPLHLTVPAFLVLWAGLAAALAGAAAWRRRSPRLPPRLILVGGAALLFGMIGGSRCTGPQLAYLALLVAAAAAGYRRLASDRPGEGVRLVLVGAVALGTAWPFLTDRLVGGTDARWYAYMFTDFLAQLRAGVFPVLAGQGEFAYNGALHPFRTAPFHLYLGGVLDLATLRALAPLSVEHLTVPACALLGALGTYLGLNALAGGRRWTAGLLAMIYVTSPGWLFQLHAADQYMTYMTIAVLPAVFYGNLRLFQGGDAAAWRWLAAGLALAWMAHGAVAFFCCVVTTVLQLGRLLCQPSPWPEWRGALRGALWFALLGACYFAGLSELPPTSESPAAPLVWLVVGAVLLPVGLVRGVLWRQWPALAVLPLAGLAWWLAGARWLAGGLAALAAAVVLGAIAGWKDAGAARRRSWELAALAGLVAGFLTPLLSGENFPGRNQVALDVLAVYDNFRADFFLPVSARVDRQGDLQPGWGLWFLLAGIAWWAWRGRSLLHRLALTAALLLLLSFIRVPGLTWFWVGNAPGLLADMTNFPLSNRLLPPFAGLVVFAGFAWLAALEARPARLAGAALLVFAGTSLWQAWPFLRRAASATATRSETVKQFRPENAVLDRYAYDLVVIPHYFSNGKSDPRLESRILNTDYSVRTGPDQTARAMEAAGRTELVLESQVEPTAPAWLNLSPGIRLEPGASKLLRFEFLDRTYDGFLILRSEHTYRDYILPDSGWTRAFGVGAGRAKVLSLWNSGDTAEDVRLFFQRRGRFGLDSAFGTFARVSVSDYVPARAPVRLLSLIPYRAEVDLAEAGWLETMRVFVPGYRARVDDAPVEVARSPSALVMVPLTPGHHRVEVTFAGSGRLRVAGLVSALAWLAWIARGLSPWWRRGPPAPEAVAA